MTSSRKPIIAKLSFFCKDRPELVWGFALFAFLFIHGATIGISDDEAYYWVLAQKPAWGYAYHPPMVAWLIALSQWLLSPLTGGNAPAVVRLPAALCSGLVFGLSLRWLRSVGIAREKIPLCAFTLLSLAGLFFLSWMMVPDLPLFVGWMIVFTATWRVCSDEWRARDLFWLAAGTCFAILSKYSGVLIAFSSGICILLSPQREGARPVRLDAKFKAIAALAAGCLIAAIPIVLWNAAHEWGSILYQLRDRHEGASLSWVRWARFWLIELFAGGPFLVVWSLSSFFKRRMPALDRFLWIWAVPAAFVFCLQPLWTDFKPHWALVVWWPMALLLAHHAGNGLVSKTWLKFQIRYGLTLGAIVILFCHFPIGNFLIYSFAGEKADPRWDPTNDLHGWSGLPGFLKGVSGNSDLAMPVVGSRYQTASEAYFAMGPGANVTMLPRDLKSRDEWPGLDLSETSGPDWSKLKRSVFFVGDNRYDAPPEFPGASCGKIGRIEEDRAGHLAKRIEIWRCDP